MEIFLHFLVSEAPRYHIHHHHNVRSLATSVMDRHEDLRRQARTPAPPHQVCRRLIGAALAEVEERAAIQHPDHCRVGSRRAYAIAKRAKSLPCGW